MDFVVEDLETEYWIGAAGGELLEVEDSVAEEADEVPYDGNTGRENWWFARIGFWGEEVGKKYKNEKNEEKEYDGHLGICCKARQVCQIG